MFSTLLTIFIALNVLSTIVILAACVVSGTASHRMEVAEVLASSGNMQIDNTYASSPATPYVLATHVSQSV